MFLAFSPLTIPQIPYFSGVLGATVISNNVACRVTMIANSTEEKYICKILSLSLHHAVEDIRFILPCIKCPILLNITQIFEAFSEL
jgi:hypothetical protein